MLGRIYEIGGYEDDKTGNFTVLCRRDSQKAVSLYVEAADAGNELALNFLGAHQFNRMHDRR